jgi:hypothetical protein
LIEETEMADANGKAYEEPTLMTPTPEPTDGANDTVAGE